MIQIKSAAYQYRFVLGHSRFGVQDLLDAGATRKQPAQIARSGRQQLGKASQVHIATTEDHAHALASPSSVRGPVEQPPCHLQRRLPGPLMVSALNQSLASA